MKIKLPKNPEPIEGFKIVSHNVLKSFNPEEMTLWQAEEQKTGFIVGVNLLKKLPKNTLNACALQYLLKHQDLIPEEWNYKLIYFWGTIYKRLGNQHVLCLCRDAGGSWDWDCSWLDDDWGVRGFATVSQQVSSPSGLKDLELRIKELEEFKSKVEKIINI
jgi:hypothetical protein